MKKNINRFLIAGVMAVAMMSMAACGSKSEPAATTAAPAAAPARTAAPAAGNAANDGELVAVITAAIAAATGVPADSVNIRSITRK